MLIKMLDGEVFEYEEGDFDTYEVNHGLLILKKGDKWIGCYNMGNVSYFQVV